MMMHNTPRILLIACLFWAGLTHAGSFVVSTHPIYLIAQAVTKGVEQPQLLLSNQSGHDVQLTPQQRQMIQQAELVLWLGKQHEAPLYKLLNRHPNSIALLDSQIVTNLPLRNNRGQSVANSIDSHVWLDPNNAVRIAYFIAVLRSQQNPKAKAQYWQNARQFTHNLMLATQQYDNLGTSSTSTLGTSNAQPYWAYHDAYQYLERVLNLKMLGALTEDSHVAPTAAQIKYLNDNRPLKRMCLLAERSANPKHYARLKPLQFQAVDESLSLEDDFVQAWKKLAEQVSQCVKQSTE